MNRWFRKISLHGAFESKGRRTWERGFLLSLPEVWFLNASISTAPQKATNWNHLMFS